MYAFSADENHLLFMDAFGTTRLTFPRRVRTARSQMGSAAHGRASISAAGVAVTWDDGWDQTVVWAFPSMQMRHRFPRFDAKGAVVHPLDGRLCFLSGAQIELLDASGARESFTLSGGIALPSLDQGSAWLDVGAPLVTAPDGSFAAYHDGVVTSGVFTASGLEVRWRRSVRVSGQMALAPHRDGASIIVKRGRAGLVIRPEETIVCTTIASPAVSGDRIAWQPDAQTIVLRDLANQTEQVFSLGPADAGIATIFVSATRLLVLPWHREALLDLGEGQRIDRKLSAKEKAVRAALVEKTHPLLLAAQDADMFLEYGRFEQNREQRSLSIRALFSGGEDLLAMLLGGCALACFSGSQPGGWGMSTCGGRGSFSRRTRPIEVAELRAALHALRDAGLSLQHTLPVWVDLYGGNRVWLGSHRARKPQHAPCSPAAAHILARALLALPEQPFPDPDALAAAGPVDVPTALAGVSDFLSRARGLDSSYSAALCVVFNHLLGANAALLWRNICCEQFWPGCGTLYTNLIDGIESLMTTHPESADVFREWFDANGIPKGSTNHYLQRIVRRLNPPAGRPGYPF